jgi:hypothetical protein
MSRSRRAQRKRTGVQQTGPAVGQLRGLAAAEQRVRGGVGGTEGWLRRLLSELERLLQVLLCVVGALEQRRLQWLRVSGRGRDVSGFGGTDWLCALRDAAREGAANSYSEARARKVSPRLTLSPPYSNKLTLL